MVRTTIACLALLTLCACSTVTPSQLSADAAANDQAPAKESAQVAVPLLLNVSWSFAEPVPETLESFIGVARAYARRVNAPDPSGTLWLPLASSKIFARYDYSYREKDGQQVAVDAFAQIVAEESAKLTGAELLWKLHRVYAKHVQPGEPRYLDFLLLLHSGGEDADCFLQIRNTPKPINTASIPAR